MNSYERMAPSGTAAALRDQFSVRLIASYIFDWIVLIVITVVGYVLGRIEPNKRAFSLADRDISYVSLSPRSARLFVLFPRFARRISVEGLLCIVQ